MTWGWVNDDRAFWVNYPFKRVLGVWNHSKRKHAFCVFGLLTQTLRVTGSPTSLYDNLFQSLVYVSRTDSQNKQNWCSLKKKQKKHTAQVDHTRPLFFLLHWQWEAAAAQHPASHRRMLATMSEKTHTNGWRGGNSDVALKMPSFLVSRFLFFLFLSSFKGTAGKSIPEREALGE